MQYLFKRQQFNLNTVTTMIIKYETTIDFVRTNQLLLSSYNFRTILDCEANKVESVSTFLISIYDSSKKI
jgi:hypothetical protein